MSFKILGTFPVNSEGMGHPIEYFRDRDIFLDCRGKLEISPTSMFGYSIYIYTYSHDINKETKEPIAKKVIIEDDVFIGSNVILYNCVLRKGCSIAVGSVLRNVEIPRYSVVSTNSVEFSEPLIRRVE